jgi:hypothetical protein
MSLEGLDDLTTPPEEVTIRLSFCMPCENNVLDVISKCKQCDCPISSLASMSFKSCPIGKW